MQRQPQAGVNGVLANERLLGALFDTESLDKKRNTLVYLVYSDRLIEGSPQNAVTAIPILPWVPVQQ